MYVIFAAEVGELREGPGDVFGDLGEAGMSWGGVGFPEWAVWDLIVGWAIELMLPKHSILLGAVFFGEEATFVAAFGSEDIASSVLIS